MNDHPAAHGDSRTMHPGSPSADAEAPSIGHYLLLHKLPESGMALAYEAQDCHNQRRVHLRILPLEGDAARVPPEAEQAALLRHPSIAQVLDVRVEKDGHGRRALIVASEPPAGRSMASLMATHEAKTGDLIRIVAETAKVLAYAHSRGVTHRDLRPSNLYLTRGGAVVVGGFAATPPDPMSPKAVRIGDPSTTPVYLAPEQVEHRAAAIGPRTDVYALGAILFEVLTARAPFRAESLLELSRRISEDTIEAPSSFRTGMAPELEVVCMKALEKDPSFRYAQAGELAEELGRVRRHEPVEAKTVNPITRRWQKLVRRQAPRVAGLVIALALAAGGAWWWLRSATAPAHAPAPPAPSVAAPAPREPETAEDVFDANRLHREGSRLIQGALDAAAAGLPDPAGLQAGEKLLERALEKYPDLVAAQVLLARSREARGDDAGALAWYTAAVKTDPELRTAYLHRGALFLRTGNLNGAVRDYGEVLKRDRSNVDACIGRGAAQHRKGNFPAAVADLSEAVRLDPRNATALAYRGFARAEAQDVAGARADLEQALKLAPEGWPLAAHAREQLAQLGR